MKKKKPLPVLLAGLILLSACRPVITTAPVSHVTPAPIITTVPPEPTSTLEPFPSLIPSPATLDAGPTAAAIQSACPTIQTGPHESILQQGSIVYREAGAPEKLWAFTAGHRLPKPVFSSEIGPASLDVEGRRVAFDEDGNEKALAIYDLQTREKSLWPWAEPWKIVDGWTRDGKVKLLVSHERQADIGETSVYALFDPLSGVATTSENVLSLPGYRFLSNNPLDGYASLSETGDLVVYTARGTSGDDIVLRNTTEGAELWRHAIGTTFIAPAAWSPDDSKVAFVMVSEEKKYSQIFSLTSDGRNLSELTRRPLADYEDYIVNFLAWSPDGTYLFLSLFEGSRGGPGFVLNTLTGEIREVCDPEVTLYLARWVSVAGRNLLAYLVYRLDETGELRLLDIDSWQTEVLHTAIIPYQIDILGWTPVEFP